MFLRVFERFLRVQVFNGFKGGKNVVTMDTKVTCVCVWFLVDCGFKKLTESVKNIRRFKTLVELINYNPI